MDAKKSSKAKRSSPRSALAQGPSAIHRFRVTDTTLITASAAGTVSTVYTLNPTAYTEYSDVSNLFSEIRVKRAVLHLVPVYNPSAAGTGQDVRGALVIGFQPDNTATAAGTFDEVWSCAGSKIMASAFIDERVFEAKIPQMAWASVGAPIPGPYAGCYGCFLIQSRASKFAANVDVVEAVIEVEYELRGRR